MQSPELAIVRQRFIPRINDGTIKLHPLVDVVHDVIGALADLETDGRGVGRQIKIKSERMGLSDASRARINLAGCQKTKQRSQQRRGELSFAPHQIVLVTTEGRAGVVIDVVLNKRNAIARLHLAQRAEKQSVTRKIVNNSIA